ncbi:MAG: leucine-rich repeat domain-containing protein [Sulfuricurvum sp.]|nr:leucine-rich repeat domain-containing protein [Sulfuricurvum sp.]
MKRIPLLILLAGLFTLTSAEQSFLKTCKKPSATDLITLKAIKQEMYTHYLPAKFSAQFKTKDCKDMYKYLLDSSALTLDGNRADKVNSKDYPNFQHIDSIKSVSLLQYFPNLEIIDVRNNRIEDITPLAKVTNLKALNISYNSIIDLKPLSSLKKLERIDIHNDQIIDITPLESIHSLQSISLYGNGISDIISLAKLPNLQELSVHSDNLCNVCDLNTSTRLKVLNLTGNTQLSTIACLQGLKNIEELNIANTKITSIDVVSNYQKLLSFNGNDYLKDLTPLVGLNDLTNVSTNTSVLLECSPKNMEEIKEGKMCENDEKENPEQSLWERLFGL